MDGTLIDSVGIWNEVDQIVIRRIANREICLEDCRVQRDIVLRQCSSADNPYLEYCAYLKQKYSCHMAAEQILQLRVGVAEDFLANVVAYKKDVEKVLEKLKAYSLTLVVVTTTSRANMNVYRTVNKNILAMAPLDEFFTRIYTREDAKVIKPNPEIYYKVMKELHVTPDECLVFEDSLIGVESAINAAIEVVAMYDRHSDSERDQINALSTFQFATYAAVLNALEQEGF